VQGEPLKNRTDRPSSAIQTEVFARSVQFCASGDVEIGVVTDGGTSLCAPPLDSSEFMLAGCGAVSCALLQAALASSARMTTARCRKRIVSRRFSDRCVFETP
jgi:hypothetical protein